MFTNQLVLDVNTVRLLTYSVINTICLGYIFYVKDLNQILSNYIKLKIPLAVLAFISWAALSYFYALNQNEVIIRFFTFLNFYVFILVLSTFIKHSNLKFIDLCLIVSIVLVAELYYSYKVYFEIIEFGKYDFNQNNKLAGIFANRNVTSSIFLMQIPFILYLYLSTNKVFIKIFTIFTLYVTLFMIFLLSSRTAYVIMSALLIVFLIDFIIKKKYIKTLWSKSIFVVFGLALVVNFSLSTLTLGQESGADAITRVSSIDTSDYSTATRLRYYVYGVNHLISNPLFGVGLGNWKIESINYDKENVYSYIVPYTMHNDFLEVGAELGLIGIILYLFIFIYPKIELLKSYLHRDKLMYLVILSSLIVYFIDSNLNFPFTRIGTFFWFSFLISVYLNHKTFNEND